MEIYSAFRQVCIFSFLLLCKCLQLSLTDEFDSSFPVSLAGMVKRMKNGNNNETFSVKTVKIPLISLYLNSVNIHKLCLVFLLIINLLFTVTDTLIVPLK